MTTLKCAQLIAPICMVCSTPFTPFTLTSLRFLLRIFACCPAVIYDHVASCFDTVRHLTKALRVPAHPPPPSSFCHCCHTTATHCLPPFNPFRLRYVNGSKAARLSLTPSGCLTDCLTGCVASLLPGCPVAGLAAWRACLAGCR